MPYNSTENVVAEINMNVFFREFTFCKNDFKNLESNQQVEFADNVVWLDDIFFVYQIKDRTSNENENDIKWFENKVLNKAVKQIKNTVKYLRAHTEIVLENEKGHRLNISDAPFDKLRKIIVYKAGPSFPEEKRFLKFYKSTEVGLIHLFHSEDYYWICKYLITPAEVEEYLSFRESFHRKQNAMIDELPEQYILAHFMETLATDHFNPAYIDNLKYKVNTDDFDIAFLIENFTNRITLTNDKTEYYPTIKEIAKLNRAELEEFRKRFFKTLEKCKEKERTIPYRVFFLRTNCAFVFIPLPSKDQAHWRNALTNYTLAQKYDQRAEKCIGLVMFEERGEGIQDLQMFWLFVEGPWQFNPETDKLLKENFPFRDVKTKRIDNRYKAK